MLRKDLLRITGWAIFAVVLVGMTGWFAIIPDGNQAGVAAAALEMLKTGATTTNPGVSRIVLEIFAISMRLFGENHTALRIPVILAISLSLFCTYRFARVYQNFEIALLTVTVLATTQATFFLSAGIASVPFLCTFYTFALWQTCTWLRDRKPWNLVLAISGIVALVLLRDRPGSTDFEGADPLLTLFPTFLPWTIFLMLGLWSIGKRIISKTAARHEVIVLLAFIFPVFLSCLNPSRTIFDVFLAYPAGALITSSYLYNAFYAQPDKTSKTLAYVHIAAGYGGLAALFCLVWFPFPENNYYGLIHFMALLSVLTWLIFFSAIRNKVIIGCIVFAIGSNLILTTYFYPNIANYEAGASLGMIVRANGDVPGKLLSYQAGSPNTLRYYAGVPVEETNDFAKIVSTKGCWVYTHQSLLDEFRAMRPDLRIAGTARDFQGSFWDVRFLNPGSRKALVTQKVLLRL